MLLFNERNEMIGWWWLVAIMCISSRIQFAISEDFSFGFAETDPEEDRNKQNAENKQPIFLPGHCAVNELLFPGDHKDDWVCDCKPGYLYYPITDSCFTAYRQGPCGNNHFLVLPMKKNIPECRRNPCRQDGRVRFQNKCYALDDSGPCSLPELSYVVGINVTTLEIDCIQQRIDLMNRFAPDDSKSPQSQTEDSSNSGTTTANSELFATEHKCLKGGRRWVNNQCTSSNISIT